MDKENENESGNGDLHVRVMENGRSCPNQPFTLLMRTHHKQRVTNKKVGRAWSPLKLPLVENKITRVVVNFKNKLIWTP